MVFWYKVIVYLILYRQTITKKYIEQSGSTGVPMTNPSQGLPCKNVLTEISTNLLSNENNAKTQISIESIRAFINIAFHLLGRVSEVSQLFINKLQYDSAGEVFFIYLFRT